VQKQLPLLHHVVSVKSEKELHMSLRGALGFAEAVSQLLGIASSERARALLAKT